MLQMSSMILVGWADVDWVCDADEEKNVALFGPQMLILIYNDKPFRLAMQIGSDKQFHS